MQGTSPEFQAAVRGSHQAVSKVEVIRDGAVVMVLDAIAGSVTADRTAANMRRFTATVADPTGELSPEDMTSLLAPFGTRVRISRGVVVQKVTTSTDLDADAVSWAEGTHDGTKVNDDGELVLGP